MTDAPTPTLQIRLYPLIKKDDLILPFIILTTIWNYLTSQYEGMTGHTAPRIALLTGLRHMCYLGMGVWWVLELVVAPPARYPDLWVVANVVWSAGWFCFFLAYYLLTLVALKLVAEFTPALAPSLAQAKHVGLPSHGEFEGEVDNDMHLSKARLLPVPQQATSPTQDLDRTPVVAEMLRPTRGVSMSRRARAAPSPSTNTSFFVDV
jgi:hypothetical protein